MEGFSIRTATDADAPAISALTERAIRTTNAADYRPSEIDRICAEHTTGQVLRKMAERDVFVAVVGGQIIGTVSLGGSKLHSLFVDPPFQGQRVGAALVSHIERYSAAREIATLWLSSSITARPFYDKLGYSAHEIEQRPFGSTIRMSKAIG